jgi:hypothetical protein
MQNKRWRPKANKQNDICIKRLFFVTFLLVTQLVFNFAAAQDKIFPVPGGNEKQLFFLQRTPNTNTIVCELNYKEGVVDKEDPIHVFWIRYQEKGQTEDLSYIQRKFAYGVKTRQISENKYELNFVSYKKYKMYLMLAADNQYHVFTTINKKPAILTRIYVAIKGGSFWSPNVEYVEVTGIDPATHSPVIERLKI